MTRYESDARARIDAICGQYSKHEQRGLLCLAEAVLTGLCFLAVQVGELAEAVKQQSAGKEGE